MQAVLALAQSQGSGWPSGATAFSEALPLYIKQFCTEGLATL